MLIRLTFIWLLTNLFLLAKAQDIRIYHAAKSQSAIFFEGDNERNARWRDREFIRPKGSKIEIVILNPNPFFYNYDLKLEDFEIKEDFPDITSLLGLINGLPDLEQQLQKGSQVLTLAMGEDPGISPFKKYQKAIQLLMDDIKRAKTFILASDEPESKRVALVMDTPDKGFRKAVNDISQLSSDKGRFNSSTLAKDLEIILENGLKDNSLSAGLAVADKVNKERTLELYDQAFTLLNNQLAATVEAIKKSCKADPVLRFVVDVTDKNQKVYMDIKKKEGQEGKLRLEENKLLCTIIPEFDRKIIELVPVVNLTHASRTPEYGVSDGIITQRESDGYKFSAGAMLLVNWLHFGKYNELAWGGGLGYSISKGNALENFNLGTMASYKQLFRIGLGVGFSSYPSGLKENIQVGSGLPANIKNIQDIVDHKRTPSFFITFSISGITLLKK